MLKPTEIRFLLYPLILLFAVSCTTTDPYTREKKVNKATKGGLIGAAAGAGVGLLVSRDTKGALIGAGIGALAGGSVGYYMDRQEAELRQELEGTGVSVTRQGDNLVLDMPGDVTFDVDRSDVNSRFYPVLNSVALVLKKYEKTSIHVTGFTDSTGSFEYNFDLSQRRAGSVADYLKAQGVHSARLFTQGMGPKYPIASNDTPEGRALNRRVELTLMPHTE